VVTSSPQYSEILQRIQNGDKYLDIGCCVGQDIRKLVHDGAPSENTYGSDLQKAFLDMGYDLFLDKSSLKTTLIAADIFDSDSDLNQLDGKIDVIHAALFLHLFDLERCTDAVRRIVKLFKDKPDCLFIGKQLGCVESGPLRDKFRHDDKSFVAMWEKIAEETGTKWDIDARLEDEDLYLRAEKMGLRVRFLPEGSRVLSFSVRRVG
jgi:SAM-dependent methyltransferase